MMMMKSVFWWRKPEYPEEPTEFLFIISVSLHMFSTLFSLLLKYTVITYPHIGGGYGRLSEKLLKKCVFLFIAPFDR